MVQVMPAEHAGCELQTSFHSNKTLPDTISSCGGKQGSLDAVLPESANSANDVRNVFSDLIGGFQPEEVEVAQQVVMKGQELQIELWKRQAILTWVQTSQSSERGQNNSHRNCRLGVDTAKQFVHVCKHQKQLVARISRDKITKDGVNCLQ